MSRLLSQVRRPLTLEDATRDPRDQLRWSEVNPVVAMVGIVRAGRRDVAEALARLDDRLDAVERKRRR
jgi:hypothetical protein